MALLVKFFHLGVVCFYSYVSYTLMLSGKYQAASNDRQVRDLHKYNLRFLTNWTYIMQLAYFSICIIVHFLDIIPFLRPIKDTINSMSNYLFTTISAPVALVVTVVFWSIYNIDRELVFPRWLDQVIPLWVNHAIHSLNSVFAILDMCLVNHKFPSYGTGAKAIIAYLGLYAVCLFGTYFNDGIWLYPFLKELTWLHRGVFAIGTVAAGILMFTILKLLNGLLWGGKVAPAKSNKPKKNNKQKSKKV